MTLQARSEKSSAETDTGRSPISEDRLKIRGSRDSGCPFYTANRKERKDRVSHTAVSRPSPGTAGKKH